jgi:hypothetical protein
LAGVRNVEPRPSVGHKFHAVLVVNSAHLASLSSPDEHRWLPIFWALDHFKGSQARDTQERGWTMAPVKDSALPDSTKALAAFREAMDNWDESGTDVAIAALARTAGTNEVYEELFRFGARDFRSIGHKAIYVANSLRTINCIGWQHAEPVLRSLAYALLNHEGDNPAKRDAEADRPWRRNRELAKKFPAGWRGGRLDDGATREMIAALRTASNEQTCDKVVELLASGISPQSIWDGQLIAAGELLARQPGIVALHAVTTSNALRYAFEASGNDDTRRMLLLQNAAFLPMFREAMAGRGGVREFKLDEMTAAETPVKKETPAEQLERIFRQVSGDPNAAAGELLGYLQAGGDPKQAIDLARVLIFLKGRDAHDYKFSSAALEDYWHVSPNWRNRFLASSVFKLRGSGSRDNSLVERTRAALNT